MPSKPIGRPRSLAADQKILDVASEMFVKQSFDAVTMEQLAAQAGVSKTTLYRRWPNKFDLALKVLMRAIDNAKLAFTQNSFEQHLTANLKGLRGLLNSDYAGLIMALITRCQSDHGFRQKFYQGFLRPVQAIGDKDLEKAKMLGQIRADVDPDLLFDQLFGLFFYRLLIAHRPITDADIQTIVNGVMASFTAASA